MMPVTERTSLKLANLGFVGAVLVVVIHVSDAWGGSSAFWRDWIIHGVARAAVPCFFVMSAFFLAGHAWEEGWWERAVRTRLRTVVVPFYCLNALALLVVCLAAGRLPGWGAPPLSDFLVGISPIPLAHQPLVFPLWYLRALMYLVLLSPLWMGVVRRSRQGAALLLACVFALWAAQRYVDVRYGLGNFCRNEYDVRCLFYFVLGAALRLQGREMLIHAGWGVAGLGAGLVLIALRTYCLASFAGLSFLVNVLGILLLLFGGFVLMPAVRWPRVLVGNAFAVYCLHVLFIWFLAPLMGHLAPQAFIGSVGGLVVWALLDVLLSVGAAELVRRCLPSWGVRALFGGR